MRNVSDKSCRENTHAMFNKNVPQIRAVFEIMWRNMLQPDRAQVTT